MTAWSSEAAPQPQVTMRRGRLAYVDERPYDRDGNGILWRRVPSTPGRGRPHLGRVHLLRQRQAMLGLLCQVCGRPATNDATDQGVLWLLGHDPDDQDTASGGVVTGHPPVCLPCAQLSIQACPHLRGHYTALRVTRYRYSGVHGVLYQPGYPHPVVHDVGALALDDDRIPWMQAAQLLIRLETYTVVDLAARRTASSA